MTQNNSKVFLTILFVDQVGFLLGAVSAGTGDGWKGQIASLTWLSERFKRPGLKVHISQPHDFPSLTHTAFYSSEQVKVQPGFKGRELDPIHELWSPQQPETKKLHGKS